MRGWCLGVRSLFVLDSNHRWLQRIHIALVTSVAVDMGVTCAPPEHGHCQINFFLFRAPVAKYVDSEVSPFRLLSLHAPVPLSTLTRICIQITRLCLTLVQSLTLLL